MSTTSTQHVCHVSVDRPVNTVGLWADRLQALGRHTVRYGLVLVLGWIGAMKFTTYEAEGISGLVSNSLLMSWAYELFSVEQLAALLGVTELAVAALIAVRPFFPKLSALGSGLAVGMFLTTLSFLFTTPGVVEPSLGFPGISVVPGQFLLKDLVLLGAAIWTAGEALHAGWCLRPQESSVNGGLN